MILVDNSKGIYYECSIADAAKKMGLSASTLYRWNTVTRKKTWNRYTVIFTEIIKIKQKKGFALKC